jgi:hypothetical protein
MAVFLLLQLPQLLQQLPLFEKGIVMMMRKSDASSLRGQQG